MTRKGLIDRVSKPTSQEIVLGGGLEPPCLSAYAPQTYVSAISPPEQSRKPKFAAREPPRKGKISLAGGGEVWDFRRFLQRRRIHGIRSDTNRWQAIPRRRR